MLKKSCQITGFLLIFLCGATGVNAKSKDPIWIGAGVFRMDAKTNTLSAENAVHIRQAQFHVYGELARYSQKNNTILITKNTRFNSDLLNGRAQKAQLDIGKNLLELSGDPEAWQAQDHLKGETIVVNLVTSQIVSKGRTKINVSVDRLKGL